MSHEFFQTIINDARSDSQAIIKYEDGHNCSLKMTNHDCPLSITFSEFDFLRNFIITNNLKCGYECATAFGISGTAAGLGMKATGGKLVTIDAYIEEMHNEANVYRNMKEVNTNDPDGLKSLRWLMKRFDLEDVITPVIGWSPDNVAQAITDGHGVNAKIDYAFIDAGHWDSAALADALAVRPFINTSRPFAVFFHDLPCFTDGMWEQLHASYGFKMQRVNVNGPTWQTGVITNLIMI